ncbi:unnamed protein product [Clonostachys rhizophaga]|uniref:Uncharacterized protein n=1 Tax=Clonostachys rhizophaga TaxID=160324 RepID=A0A9N9YG51_9HYPO|nr:unnamed protein product [Clonostachys rhizophaga]
MSNISQLTLGWGRPSSTFSSAASVSSSSTEVGGVDEVSEVLIQIDGVQVIKCELPIALFVCAPVDVEIVALDCELGIESHMRRLHGDGLLLDRRLLLFLFLLVKLNPVNVFQGHTRLEGSQLPEKLLLVALPVTAASSTALLLSTLLRLLAGLPQVQRHEPVALNVPREQLVEELAVHALLALLDVVDAAEEDPPALVPGHGRARAGRRGRVDRLLALLPPDGRERVRPGVGGRQAHAEEEAVVVNLGLEDVLLPLALAALAALLLDVHGGLDARVPSVEDGSLLMGEQGEGGPGIWFELSGGQDWADPDEVDRIEDPEIRQVLGLVGSVLEATEENDVVLPVRHSVATPGGRALVLALDLDLGPLSGCGLQSPEVRVVVEGALLGRGELAAEKIDVRGIGRGDAAPLITADVVDEQVVVELGERAVEVLAAKEQQVVGVVGGCHQSRGGTRLGRGIADSLGDLEELLLLAGVFLEDLVEVDILGVAALDLGGLGLGLLLALGGLLGCLLSLLVWTWVLAGMNQ